MRDTEVAQIMALADKCATLTAAAAVARAFDAFDSALDLEKQLAAETARLETSIREALSEQWQPIETAPRGSGEDGPGDTRHPDYVQPPKLLLWTAEGAVVGYYDWYYHEGYGNGAEPNVSAWRGQNGEQTYGASHWRNLPAAPSGAAKEPT